MDNSQINTEKIVKHWINTSDDDFQTMLNLFDSRNYHWSLFMGHLVIEKLLKGKIVKETNQHAHFSHNLRKLRKITDLELDEEKIKWLDTITTFNLNAKYDNYKQEFFENAQKILRVYGLIILKHCGNG